MKIQLINGKILDLPSDEARVLIASGKARVYRKTLERPRRDKMLRSPVICK